MDTPVAAFSLQMRRGKRHKASSATPPQTPDLHSAVDLLLKDANLPPHLRVVISHLLEIKDEFSKVVARNQELVEENKVIQEKSAVLLRENASLQSEVNKLRYKLSSKENGLSQPNIVSTSTMSYDEIERKRSVVISGIPESFAPVASSRVLHDIAHLRQFFDFLHIECQPFVCTVWGALFPVDRTCSKLCCPLLFMLALSFVELQDLRHFL